VSLSPTQKAYVDRLLRNESDMAYRRRVWTMLSYLDLCPRLTVLDCGAGMGFYTSLIGGLDAGIRVWAIDLDEKALRFALQHVRLPNTLFLRANAQAFPFPNAFFDRVLMTEVLEHLPDDEQALTEVWRVLKPGGVLALTVPHDRYPYWYDPINRIAEDVFGRPIRHGPFAGIWANHYRLYSREAVVGLLERVGYVVEDVAMLTHYCFPATQTIVYTIGKGLVEHDLLPEAISRSTHRFRGRENSGNWLNPINWVLGLFRWIDRWNENPRCMVGKETFVNVAVKARKP